MWSQIYSRLCIGTQEMDVSPSSPSLGGIPEGYSVAPQVASEVEQKPGKGLTGKELEINLGLIN